VYLQHSGFDVKSATDGQEAIRLIPEYRPDLIVLDLMMRPVDGWAVLQWLRTQQIKPMIPVLVLTALYQLAQQIKGFEEGAIDYLTKPTQPSIIVDHIHKILGLSEEQRAMLQRARIEQHRKLLERVSAPSPDEFAY